MDSSATYLFLVGVSLISKVMGFIREAALAALFGSTAETDAYLVAVTIPMLLPSLIGAFLSTNFIPMLQKKQFEGGTQAWNALANNIFNIVAVLLLLLCLLGAAVNEWIIAWISPGFAPSTTALAVRLTYITLPVVIFSGLSTFAIGVYHSRNSFVIPMIFVLCLNIVILYFLFLAAKYGITWLAAGYTIGLGAQCIFQLLLLKRVGYHWRWHFDLKDEGFRKMVWLCGPIAIANMVGQINMWVDRMLGSTLPAGGISGLYYGERLNTTLHTMLVLTVATMLFPKMSQKIAEGNQLAFGVLFRKGCSFILFISLPMAIACAYYAEDIVKMVFMRGVFDQAAVAMTTGALFYFTLGLPALGLVELTNRAFYSLQDTKAPLLTSSLAIASNVVLSFTLIAPMQQRGLALASSIAMICQAMGLLYILDRRVAGVITKTWLVKSFQLIGVAIAGIAMIHAAQFANWLIGLIAYLLLYGIGIGCSGCLDELEIKSRIQEWITVKIRS